MKHESSFQNILRLTFPTFLSQATLMLVGMADLYFAGGLGTSAVAALSIANTTWATIAAFFEGFRLGTTVIASRFFGAQRHEDMHHVARIGLIASACLGLFFIIFGRMITTAIYNLVAVNDPVVRAMGQEYLPYILAAGGFVFATFVIDGMFRGANRVVIPTIITIITQVVNISLNAVFVWGLFGVTPMGIRGIALATLIAYVVASFFAVMALYWRGFKEVFQRLATPIKGVLKEYSRVAADVGLHSGFRFVATFLFTIMLGRIGTSSIASYQIAVQVFQASYLPGLAFMFTMSMLMGKLVGGRHYGLITHTAARVSATALGAAFLIGTFIFLFAEKIGLFFSPNDVAVALSAASLIRIVAINQFLVMTNFMFRGFLNGAHQTTFLVVASLITTYGVFLPLAYASSFVWGYGLYGAYLCTCIWSAVDTCTNAIRSYFVYRQLLGSQENTITDTHH